MDDEIQRAGEGGKERVERAFRRRWGRPPTVVVRAPGRVALLGAHVDYSDGWVMPGAVERAVWLAAAPRDDRRWGIAALDLDRERILELDRLPPPAPDEGRSVDWNDFPAGVAWVLAEAGEPPPALDAVYGGDLPAGAGVSSSAAVEVAFLLASKALAGDRDPDREACARACRRLENRYLGLQSGIMDPFASLFGRRDHVVFLDCRTHDHELLPLPPGLAVLVVDSGVRRRLASSGFNDRRDQCARASELLAEILGRPVPTLRDVDVETFEEHAHRLPPEIARRARHAVEEMARVRKAAEDLRSGDVEAFGRAMGASHRSSRDLYEVSLPELDRLCATAWDHPGCLGAKLMGGGFGGCVAALVREKRLESLEAALAEAYERDFARVPAMFRTRLADGAEILPAA